MLTYVLIGINVLVQLGAMLERGERDRLGGSAAPSCSPTARCPGPAVADGECWRLVTAGFLHAGLLHLLFNMFALYVLGAVLEPAIGRLRFAPIYFVSLLAGSFGALLLEPDALTVGASGAIFGLMGAAVVVMRNRGINPMESGLGLWLGLNLSDHLRDPRHLDRRPPGRPRRRGARRAADVRPARPASDAAARPRSARGGRRVLAAVVGSIAIVARS